MAVELYADEGSKVLSTSKKEHYSTSPTGGMLYRISPDARGAALGSLGVATTPDAFSLHYNMSKLAFTSKRGGVAFGFTPWMDHIVKDMNISNLFGYFSWGQQQVWQHAVSGAIRYFSMGKMHVLPANSIESFEVQPYELSVDAGYALRYGKHWAAGISMKYLKSDYNSYDGGDIRVAHNLLFDLSLTYQTALSFERFDRPSMLRAGVALNNIGNKVIIQRGVKHFPPPIMLRLGVGMELPVAAEHQVSLYAESNSLLVPPLPSTNSRNYKEELQQYLGESVAEGLFRSQPSHLWKQTALSIGAEYMYQELFYGRLGYKMQKAQYRADSGLSIGGGLRYKGSWLDLGYFIARDADSPLNSMFRFDIGIGF